MDFNFMNAGQKDLEHIFSTPSIPT